MHLFEQYLFEINLFFNIVNDFTDIFDQFNMSLLNFSFFPQKKKNSYWNLVNNSVPL